ncbi:MAG: hypothetical protein AB1564_07805 [Chloroflexota bacterium]
MTQQKFDGVIEAVRYSKNGQIEFVRAYERRGATFSDRVLLDRKTLLARLKTRKKFLTGRRRELWAGTFETGKTVQAISRNGKEILATRAEADRDELEGVPVL